MERPFTNRKLKDGGLLSFGFTLSGGRYFYSAGLADGQFVMTVEVTEEGSVSAEVTDRVSGEPYVLHRVSDAQGPLAGRVREEYGRVLAAVAEACFEPDVFRSGGAGQIIRHIREKYGCEPEFLWQRFPRNAVFRRPDNAKWFAALLTVHREKLGLGGEGEEEILDLRMLPEDVGRLVDGKRYFPGYHMNKKHWVTVCAGGAVPLEEIFSRIDDSYVLAARKSSHGTRR